MKSVCVFGASITSGRNDFKEGGWCDQLKRYFMPRDIFVFNLGIADDDTKTLLERIKAECQARNPEFIIIALGGNDTQYLLESKEFRISIEQTKDNLEKIVKIGFKFTKDIVFVGLTKVDEEKINSVYKTEKCKIYKNKYLKKYNKAIERVANKYDLEFIPTFDLLKKDDFDEGLHPNYKGHKKLYNRIVHFIEHKKLFD